MGRGFTAKMSMYVIVLLLLVWPIYQMVDWANDKGQTQDPIHLLYQVSLFQMELLNSYLGEANQIKATGELTILKQSLYSAGYTHERLVLAVGPNELVSLTSLTQMQQMILRMQIGGERALKPAEVQIFADAAKQFSELYGSYEKLMSSNGHVISSQNEKLKKQDSALGEMIRKKMLQ